MVIAACIHYGAIMHHHHAASIEVGVMSKVRSDSISLGGSPTAFVRIVGAYREAGLQCSPGTRENS